MTEDHGGRVRFPGAPFQKIFQNIYKIKKTKLIMVKKKSVNKKSETKKVFAGNYLILIILLIIGIIPGLIYYAAKQIEEKGPAKKSETKNIFSIILGGISILISWILPYLIIVTGTIGIILAYSEKGKNSAKLNKWGFILNLIGLVLGLIFLTLTMFFLVYVGNNPELLN